MPRYRYQAVNRWGDPFRGDREADDPDHLARALAAEGLELREAELAPETYEAQSAGPDASLRDKATCGTTGTRPNGDEPAIPEGWPERRGPRPDRPGTRREAARLSEAESRELVEQLAGLTAAGLPLSSGLRAAAEEAGDSRLRAALDDLADHLDAGESTESAIEHLGRRMPAHLQGLVLAAVRSGRIGNVLGEFVNYAQIGDNLRRSLWLALAYPVMLLGFLVLIFGFASVVVIPSFKVIYMDFGVNLPILTMMMVRVSDAIVEHGLATLSILLAGVAVIWIAARLLLDPASRRRMLHRIPLFGPLRRWTALAEFSHYLGLMIDCGLTLSRALPLAAQGARDPELEMATEQIAEEVENGRPLSEALAWWDAIPVGLVKMLRWSEGRQSLGEALHMAGAMFEARARSQAAFIGAVSVVIAVILVIWGAGLLVMGLFLPLIRLISVLSG